MVGEVAMEAPSRVRGRADDGLADADTALVGGDGEVDRHFGVVRQLLHVTAARYDAVDAQRAVVALDGAACALDVELGPPDRAHVALAERGFTPVGPLHPEAELVDVGAVVPDPRVGAAEHATWRRSVELDDPVDVVGPPVVDRSTRDRVLRVPGSARMLESADEGLEVEDLADLAVVDDAAQRQPVAVPAAALVHGDGAVVRGGGGDD